MTGPLKASGRKNSSFFVKEYSIIDSQMEASMGKIFQEKYCFMIMMKSKE